MSNLQTWAEHLTRPERILFVRLASALGYDLTARNWTESEDSPIKWDLLSARFESIIRENGEHVVTQNSHLSLATSIVTIMDTRGVTLRTLMMELEPIFKEWDPEVISWELELELPEEYVRPRNPSVVGWLAVRELLRRHEFRLHAGRFFIRCGKIAPNGTHTPPIQVRGLSGGLTWLFQDYQKFNNSAQPFDHEVEWLDHIIGLM